MLAGGTIAAGDGGIDATVFVGAELDLMDPTRSNLGVGATRTGLGDGTVGLVEADIDLLNFFVLDGTLDIFIAPDTVTYDLSLPGISVRLLTGPQGPFDEIRGFGIGVGPAVGGGGVSVTHGGSGGIRRLRELDP